MNPRVQKLLPLSVALLTMLVFAPALRNGFVDWDDPTNFLNNPSFRGLGWEQIHWMWTSHVMGHYIPLTWMTLGLDYSLWDMEPLGYHLTNIVWHAANAVLFYFVALAIFRKAIPETSAVLRERIPLGALCASLIFALHPLRAESVAWITERRDVVSGLFYLLAILVYLRGVPEGPGQRMKSRCYWGSLILFVAGVLSKEIVVTLPVVLLILDYYPLRRRGLGMWIEKIPFLAIGLADGVLSMYIVHGENMTIPLAVVGWFARVAASTYGLAFYLWKTLLPTRLGPFYALTGHRVDPRALPFQLSLLVVLTVIAACVLLRRRIPALAAVALAYFVTLIPVLGIFQNGAQIAADRYSYLSCLGWALLAGAVLIHFRSPAIPAIAAVVLVALSVLTWRQVQVWRDADALWTRAIQVDPSFLAYDNLGLVLSARGDTLGAVEQYRNSIGLFPNYADAHNNLGASLMSLGEWDGAEREYQAAVMLKPDLARAHGGLGFVLMKQGKRDEAIREYRIALQLDPGLTPVRGYLDEALKSGGPTQ